MRRVLATERGGGWIGRGDLRPSGRVGPDRYGAGPRVAAPARAPPAKLGVELHSSYVGHARAETSCVTELALWIGDTGAKTGGRELRGAEVPVVYARRRCLNDHLERLQQLLEEVGFGAARIDVDDETLLAIETGRGLSR